LVQLTVAGGPGTVVVDSAFNVKGGGRLSATGSGTIHWQGGWMPSLDRAAKAELLLRSNAFPIETARPVISSYVTKLEGMLDGDLHMQWKPGGSSRNVDLGMDLKLRDGVVHVPQIGEEIRGLAAHLTSATAGIIKIQDIRAQAQTGQATGSVTARLDGLDLRDLSGEFDVKEGEDIPLTILGVPLGTAHGRFLVHALRREDEVAITLTAQGFHMALPHSASPSAKAAGASSDLDALQPLPPNAVSRTRDDLRWNITVALLDSELRGSGLRLLLSSSPSNPPNIQIGTEVTTTGELMLSSGELDLLGMSTGFKLFQIDRGVVRFRSEDVTNPYVNLTAHYNVADGSVIYCEYVGLLKPVTRDKLQFRSSPPRTQEEIVALLLFGDAAVTAARRPGAAANEASPKLGPPEAPSTAPSSPQ